MFGVWGLRLGFRGRGRGGGGGGAGFKVFGTWVNAGNHLVHRDE